MTNSGGNGIESYAMDEFDNPPKGPAGVHRGKRSAVARYTPFVVVLVVAALCKQQQEEAAKKQQEEEAAEQQQEQQAAQVDRSLSVRVINGTGISGYAATKQGILNQSGYANVAAANPSGTLPASTVVWYQNDSDKATAEDVASTLGISNVQQVSGLSASIVVILLS